MHNGQFIALREYREGDLDLVTALLNDPGTGFDLERGGAPALTRESIRRELEAEPQSGEYRYIIQDPQEKAIGLWKVQASFKDRRADLTWRMFPEAWEQGFAADSLHVLLRILFRELDLNRAVTALLASEEAALMLFLAQGFQEEARLKEHAFHEGRYEDVLILGLLGGEYRG